MPRLALPAPIAILRSETTPVIFDQHQKIFALSWRLMSSALENNIVKWITISILVATGLASGVEYFGEADKNHWLLAKMIFGVLAAILAGVQSVIIARNQQNHADGIQQGHANMQNAWKEVSRRMESALNAGIEMSSVTGAQKTLSARMGIDRLMSTFTQIVSSIFQDIPKSTLTVTLGLPNTADNKIIIVELLHEADGRTRGNDYPLPQDINACNSMSLAFRDKRAIYTADAWEIPELRGKRYRSILSIPITGQNGVVIGVLNIDTPVLDAFGPRDPDNAALASVLTLSLPVQRAIAQFLITSNVYSEYRAR